MRTEPRALAHGVRALCLTLAALLVTSCDDDVPPEPTPLEQTPREQTPPAQTPPAESRVRGVLISATATTLAPGQSVGLGGFIEGLGLKSRNLRWTLQGPGRLLSPEFGGSVDATTGAFYEAPPASTGSVTVVASSVEDPRVSASLQLTVAQPSTPDLEVSIGWSVCRPYRDCPTSTVFHDGQPITAYVKSTYEVVSVVASVDGAVAPMPLSMTEPGLYEGDLDLRGVARGARRLEVTVTDSRGNTLVTPAQIVVDRPARLRVEAPLAHHLAVPGNLNVSVVCIDDTPGCELTLNVTLKDPQEAAKVIGSRIDTVVDLSAFPDQTQTVELVALDALGQRTAKQFQVTVVAHPALQKVASVPGTLVEADATRLLYLPSDTPEGQPRPGFTIRERASGAESHFPLPPNLRLKDTSLFQPSFEHVPRLSTSGAVSLMRPTGGSEDNLYAYRTGPGDLLMLEQDVLSFAVGGDFVLWETSRPDPQQQYHWLYNVWLRNLSSGTTVDLGDVDVGEVLADGTTVFADEDKDIVLFKDGAQQKVIQSPDPVSNHSPLTDGTRIVFARREVPEGPTALMLWTEEELHTLSPDWRPGSSSSGGVHAVRDGWVAFTDRGPGGVTQVWLRSPDGVKRKVTDFSTPSLIVALGDGGRVAVRTDWNKLSVTRADGTLQELGPVPSEHDPVWLDGAWHFLVQDTLFRVQ